MLTVPFGAFHERVIGAAAHARRASRAGPWDLVGYGRANCPQEHCQRGNKDLRSLHSRSPPYRRLTSDGSCFVGSKGRSLGKPASDEIDPPLLHPTRTRFCQVAAMLHAEAQSSRCRLTEPCGTAKDRPRRARLQGA
jgi:hypothetical protein